MHEITLIAQAQITVITQDERAEEKYLDPAFSLRLAENIKNTLDVDDVTAEVQLFLHQT